MPKIKPDKTNVEYTKYLQGLGERIREYRKAQDRTQKAFSDDIGVSAPYFYMVESGQQNVSLYTIWMAAKALGLSVELLLAEGDIWEEPTRKSVEQLAEAFRKLREEHTKLMEHNAKVAARMAELTHACNRLMEKLGRGSGVAKSKK